MSDSHSVDQSSDGSTVVCGDDLVLVILRSPGLLRALRHVQHSATRLKRTLKALQVLTTKRVPTPLR